MQISAEGIRGNQGNRISYAEALASYVSYKYKKNGLTLTPGLRFENIKLYRDNLKSWRYYTYLSAITPRLPHHAGVGSPVAL